MIPRIVRLALLLLLALALAPRIPDATAAPARPLGKWRLQVPDSLGMVGEMATLALDRDDAHIAYFQNGECALKYATKVPGGWSTEYVEGPLEAPPVGYAPCPLPGSLKLDRLGRPHLSYYRAFPGWLVYAEASNGTWVKEVVDGPGTSLGAYSSLALDLAGQPSISYYTGDVGAGGLKFAHRTGAGWTIEFVDQAASTSTSLTLDPHDVPHIAYMGIGLRYATRTPAGWVTEVVDSAAGMECSLALDASGAPHISYRGADGRLGHAWHGATGWVRETIEGTQGARFTSLALDESGRARISYYDDVARDLMFAFQEGSGWTLRCVDSAGDVGEWTSLALNDKGRPRLAYCDATRGNLRFAEEFGPPPGKPDGQAVVVADDDGRSPSAGPAGPPVSLAVTRVGGQSFLDYTLPADGEVRLTAYDVSGRCVAVLVEGPAAAGRHRIAWSAPGVAPGMYFCRLRACGATVTRSVLRLR